MLRIRLIAVIGALMLTAALGVGYFELRSRQAKVTASLYADPSGKAQPVPMVQVTVNEAVPKGAQTVIYGTVNNISGSSLVDVVLVFQLQSRSGTSTGTKEAQVEPSSLDSDKQGRFQFTLATHDWSSARLVKVLTGPERNETAYRDALGAPRPVEPPPASEKVVIGQRSGRAQFLNSPDNPVVIR